MTDKKWVAASAAFGPGGLPQVLFKCWEGGNLQLGIIVGSYNDSASYTASVTAKFRVDKDEPVDIIAVPTNVNGMLTLSANSENDDELIQLLKSILESEHRVALSFGDAVYQSDVRGTSKAIGAMFKICGLAGEETKADDAPKDKPEVPTENKNAASPAASAKPKPAPPTPATGEGKLDRTQCAIVLEAVKLCEDIRDCSASAVETHFASSRKAFESMAGDSVFTTAKLYAHCQQVCKDKSYKLLPARTTLCGY